MKRELTSVLGKRPWFMPLLQYERIEPQHAVSEGEGARARRLLLMRGNGLRWRGPGCHTPDS